MSETRMVFYRFRGGTGGRWSYRVYGDLPVGRDIDEDEMDEVARDLLNRLGYHRVYIEQVERPPLDWLVKEIDKADRLSHHYAKQRDRLWALLHAQESEELTQWESGRMVEWCMTHDCELAACGSRDTGRCKGDVRISYESGRNGKTAPDGVG